MTLTADDRLAIIALIALHGHLVDSGALDTSDRCSRLTSSMTSVTWVVEP